MRLLLNLSLLCTCTAIWANSGANVYRTNLIYVNLPTPSTVRYLLTQAYSLHHLPGILRLLLQGVTVLATIPPLNENCQLLPPLIATVGGAPYTIITDGVNCVVSFYDQNFNAIASWTGCSPGDYLAATPALNVGAQTLIIASYNGLVYAVDMQLAWLGKQLWGPVLLNSSISQDLIVVGAAAWAVGDDGTAYSINIATGHVIGISQVQCNGQSDGFATAFTEVSVYESSVTAVTNGGCLVSLLPTGKITWQTAPMAPGVSFSGAVPPVVDTGMNHIYTVSLDGVLCCNTGTGALGCRSWPRSCIHLPVSEAVIAGIALGPDSTAFHQGQIFVIDSAGTLFTAFAANGANISSYGGTVTLGSVVVDPVVVPNAFGADINVMLVVTADERLLAVYVGDAALADDDNPSDDDGYGNAGLAWAFELRNSTMPAAVIEGTPLSTMPSFVVRDDGHIIVPLTSGYVVVVGPQHAAPSDNSEAAVIAVISVVCVIVVAGVGVTLWCAYRHRRRLKMAALEERMMTQDDEDDPMLDKPSYRPSASSFSFLSSIPRPGSSLHLRTIQ
jgi:hypothetical protein